MLAVGSLRAQHSPLWITFSGIPVLSAKCFTEDYLFHLRIKGNNTQQVIYVSSVFCSATNSLLSVAGSGRDVYRTCVWWSTCALAKPAKRTGNVFFLFPVFFVSFRDMEIYHFCIFWQCKACISLYCWHMLSSLKYNLSFFLSFIVWITEDPNSVYYCSHKYVKYVI